MFLHFWVNLYDVLKDYMKSIGPLSQMQSKRALFDQIFMKNSWKIVKRVQFLLDSSNVKISLFPKWSIKMSSGVFVFEPGHQGTSFELKRMNIRGFSNFIP